jgi:hypothetical protein
MLNLWCVLGDGGSIPAKSNENGRALLVIRFNAALFSKKLDDASCIKYCVQAG